MKHYPTPPLPSPHLTSPAVAGIYLMYFWQNHVSGLWIKWHYQIVMLLYCTCGCCPHFGSVFKGKSTCFCRIYFTNWCDRLCFEVFLSSNEGFCKSKNKIMQEIQHTQHATSNRVKMCFKLNIIQESHICHHNWIISLICIRMQMSTLA